MSLTDEESFAVTVIRLNKASPRTEIVRTWRLGRISVTFSWRSKKNLWGRFGGGWNWKLGFIAGGGTVIFDLLIFSLRFNVNK